MKKSNPLFLMLVAAVCAACSSDTLGLKNNTQQPSHDGPVPVNFSAYTSRTLTRSGAVGSLTTAKLTDTNSDFGKAGFGVFAYYTNADDYASDARPNFMFNQQVKWDGTNSLFDYSPVRYWPNEYGETAQSEDIDKVSFFAYAPYVEVNPATGYLKDAGNYNEGAAWGITGTSRNTYTGDPLVKYITSFETEKSVDLCWGVYNEGDDGWNIMNGHQTITNGLPWLNVQRSGTVEQRLKFTFCHATAKLNVQIDANVDGSTYDSSSGSYGTELGTHAGVATGEGNPDGATKVYVRSITFTGIAQQGALNLNNVKANVPLWMNYTGTGWIENGQSVTIHDGLRDGYEGTESAEANSETVRGLNPNIISNEGNTMPGVTNTSVNLFGRYADNTDLNEGIYVIPTGERVKMTIVYDVETAVPDLPGYLSDGETHGISIENRITTDLKSDNRNLTFEGGKSYTLRLHLGMNSVKFDAEVNDTWDIVDDISVPRDGIALSNIMQSDINENRGTVDNPRAWVICEDGDLHLCQGGNEVDPSSDAATPKYLTWDGEEDSPITQGDDPDDDHPLSCHKKKVAVVCYVSSTGSVDKSTLVSGASYHGLAIALEDAGSECKWFTSNSEHCASTYTIPDDKVIATNEILHLKGIDYTNQLGNATGDCADHTHDAAKQALAYSNQAAGANVSHKTPTGTSQWFMPTIGQWSMIVQGLSGDGTGLKSATVNNNYKAAVLNKYIETAAGGTGLSDYPYWACTEWEDASSEHFAWTIDFENGCGTHCNKAPDTSQPLVRPVIAF